MLSFRLLLRVRVVFLKQTLTWMIHGSLQDQGQEFYIQKRYLSNDSNKNDVIDEVVQQLSSALSTNSTDTQPEVLRHQSQTKSSKDTGGFSWSSSFGLRFEFMPESHVAPRIATKVLFAGKAVQLIQMNEKFDFLSPKGQSNGRTGSAVNVNDDNASIASSMFTKTGTCLRRELMNEVTCVSLILYLLMSWVRKQLSLLIRSLYILFVYTISLSVYLG